MQNLQRSALNRLLSVRRLNRMLSTNTSLVGQGMDAAELLNHLYADLITSPKTLDLSQKSLQLHFATQLRELLEEDKLNPSVKAEIKGMLYKLEKFAKKEKQDG